MIVVSLLLILVAVALLVLGLAGGSSPLLISSIVASLLAAVALVIGARQAATRAPQAGRPGAAARDAPCRHGPPARRGRRRRDATAGSAAYGDAAGAPVRGDAHSDFSGSDPVAADSAVRLTRPRSRRPADPDSALDEPRPTALSRMSRDRPFSGPASWFDDGRRSPDDEAGSAATPRLLGRRRPGLTSGGRSPDDEAGAAATRRSPDSGSGFDGGRRSPDDEPDWDDDLDLDDDAGLRGRPQCPDRRA